MSDFWAPEGEEVLAAKLHDKEEYERSLRQRFGDAIVNDDDQDSDC